MKRNTAKVIALIIVIAMVITSFSFILFLPGVYGATSANNKYIANEIQIVDDYMNFLLNVYKDELSYSELIDGAFDGITNALGDKYSEFYDSVAAGNTFVETIVGEFGGIGIGGQTEDGKHKIITVNEGAPAEKVGIKVGDVIIEVDGTSVQEMSLSEAMLLIRGEVGTQVTLKIDRNGQMLTFTVTRESISVQAVTYEMVEGNIGYIKLASFDADADKEFEKAYEALVSQGATSMILDVRNNGGGLVDSALDMADSLLNSSTQTIVKFYRQGEAIDVEKATAGALKKLPMVILGNGESASSTEILIGALTDNDIATFVGTTTYGKGVAQEILTLANGDMAKISTMYFVTPNGTEINEVGITPDVYVENTTGGNASFKSQYQAFAPMTEHRDFGAGEMGLNVYGAQQRLAMMGLYTGVTTAYLDEATQAAILEFQKQEGIAITGILDIATSQKLEAVAYEFAHDTNDATVDLQKQTAIEILKN